MFIETEATPNPATLKFLPGRDVLGSRGTADFVAAAEAAGRSPLAERVFLVGDVARVFLGADFVTVTKADDADWTMLRPRILGAIMEHFLSGAPVLDDGSVTGAADDDGDFDPADAETVAVIKELIEERVRPAVANDGGDITFRAFREGVVYLAMRGSCAGCPSSTATLRHGIENLLKHYLPDVRAVRAVA